MIKIHGRASPTVMVTAVASIPSDASCVPTATLHSLASPAESVNRKRLYVA